MWKNCSVATLLNVKKKRKDKNKTNKKPSGLWLTVALIVNVMRRWKMAGCEALL